MMRTARYVTYDDDAADDATQRASAVDTLREGFRSDGYMLDEGTVTGGERVPVLISEERGVPDYRPVPPDQANGFYVDWTGEGTPRLTDADVPVVIVDADGDVTVPEPVATEGGDLRVRHGYNADVTVTAYGTDGPVGYLFATPLDDDVVHMELLGGTDRLHVERDADE